MFNFLKKVKGNNRFADKNSDNNIILTDDVQLSLDTAQTGKNLNVCVVGDAGTGKTYNYVLPNILQANTSYVITDRGGYLLNKTGKFLKEQGYIIKVLNLNDTEHSTHYNPFDYVYDNNGVCNEAAVTRMVDTLLIVPKTVTDTLLETPHKIGEKNIIFDTTIRPFAEKANNLLL